MTNGRFPDSINDKWQTACVGQLCKLIKIDLHLIANGRNPLHYLQFFYTQCRRQGLVQCSLADICRHRDSGGTGFLFYCDILFIAKLYFLALGTLVPILRFYLLRPPFLCLFFSLSLSSVLSLLPLPVPILATSG